MKSDKMKKYSGFTLVEMLITMIVLMIIFLAIGNVLNTMIKTSNTVSGRMLVREEGEYLAEVFRRYIRNSRIDDVKLYFRDEASISFDENYSVVNIQGMTQDPNPSEEKFATEIHYRPTVLGTGEDQETDRVVCIGFFNEEDDGEIKGHIVRSAVNFVGDWANDYEPEQCFPPSATGTDFRKNFVVLNSDLVYIEGLSIRNYTTNVNVYYEIDIDMQPRWGVGGLSNYRDADGSPTYRKSFVVQTRRLSYL